MADGMHFPSDLQIESMSKSIEGPVHSPLISSVQPSSNANAAKLHVVMMPYPVQGQIIPMMEFARLLTSRQDVDIMVTFVNNKHNHDRIQQARTATSTDVHTSSTSPSATITKHAQPESKLHFTWVDNGLPPDFDYSEIAGALKMEFYLSTLHMKEPFKQLLQSLNHKGPPVSCVLFGLFCPWVQSVAAELAIPNFMFWTQSATVFSIYYHMPLLVANGFFPYNKKGLPGCNEDHAEATDLVTYIPGLPPLPPSSFPDVLHVDDLSGGNPILAAFREQFRLVGSCDGVIINSFEELERDTCQALEQELPCSVSLVGPLLPSAFLDVNGVNDKTMGASLLQEKSECIKWLDGKQKQSVLYISFGSLFTPSAAELKDIAIGIKSSKQPYLWVILPHSSFRDVSDILPKGFVEDTKDYGLIIPWAPQVQVLSHPSVGAFLTHCGWNSTLESLSMGMPMITFPIFLDQPLNSTYACDIWKVGMALKRQDDGKVKSEDVEKVVRTVLQEEEGFRMREQAGKLRDAARQAVQAQGSSYAHTEKFIQALRNRVKANTPAIHDHHAKK